MTPGLTPSPSTPLLDITVSYATQSPGFHSGISKITSTTGLLNMKWEKLLGIIKIAVITLRFLSRQQPVAEANANAYPPFLLQ